MTLFHAAVERASCEVHKLPRIGRVPISLTLIVLTMVDGLFGLCGSESWDQLFRGAAEKQALLMHEFRF